MKNMNQVNVGDNFKTITNFSNYLINMAGKVYNKVNNKFIKPNNGVVYIFDDYGRRRIVNVAHKVLETFVGNPDKAYQVCYKNGDKNDSSLGNIEWKVPATNPVSRPCAKPSRLKYITDDLKLLNSMRRELEDEHSSIIRLHKLKSIVKNNIELIVNSIADGEKISNLTMRLLGEVVPKKELSNLIKDMYGVSLQNLVFINKLNRSNPEFYDAINRVHRSRKLKKVVFNDVA